MESDELATTIREALAALAAGDPSCSRFGAAHHRYELAPPRGNDLISAFRRRGDDDGYTPIAIPGDLKAFACEVGATGAGPGYGFLGIDGGIARADAPWRSGLAIAHLGCGYAAIVSLGRDDLWGTVWIDARAVGVAKLVAPSFTAFYAEWIARAGSNVLPDPLVPVGACPLPNALGGYLGVCEQRLGIEAGTLAGDALHDALADLGPHSIEIAAESSVLFADGTRVDPCVSCARLVESMRVDGLRPDVVRPGERPATGHLVG